MLYMQVSTCTYTPGLPLSFSCSLPHSFSLSPTPLLSLSLSVYSEEVRKAASSAVEPVSSSPRRLSLPSPFYSSLNPLNVADPRRASTGAFSATSHPWPCMSVVLCTHVRVHVQSIIQLFSVHVLYGTCHIQRRLVGSRGSLLLDSLVQGVLADSGRMKESQAVVLHL